MHGLSIKTVLLLVVAADLLPYGVSASALYFLLTPRMAGPSSGALHEYNDLASAQYPYSQNQQQNREDTSPESEFEIVAVADYRNGQAGDGDELRAQDLANQLRRERQQDWQAHPQREEGYDSQLLYRQTSESGSSGHGHSLLGRQHQGYHAAGAESEISLPLYRSRSHSILEASQNLLGNTATTTTASSRLGQLDSSMQENEARLRTNEPDNQANVPKIRAVDFHTGKRYDSAESGTPAQAQAGEATAPASSSLSSSAKARHVDFAASVTQALHDVQDQTQDDKAVPPRPGLERINSDYDMDDDHNTTFDDYDWSDDDELVKQLDERYEKEYKEQQGANAPGSRRRTVIRQFSPVQYVRLPEAERLERWLIPLVRQSCKIAGIHLLGQHDCHHPPHYPCLGCAVPRQARNR